jgi:hypothetical protein
VQLCAEVAQITDVKLAILLVIKQYSSEAAEQLGAASVALNNWALQEPLMALQKLGTLDALLQQSASHRNTPETALLQLQRLTKGISFIPSNLCTKASRAGLLFDLDAEEGKVIDLSTQARSTTPITVNTYRLGYQLRLAAPFCLLAIDAKLPKQGDIPPAIVVRNGVTTATGQAFRPLADDDGWYRSEFVEKPRICTGDRLFVGPSATSFTQTSGSRAYRTVAEGFCVKSIIFDPATNSFWNANSHLCLRVVTF